MSRVNPTTTRSDPASAAEQVRQLTGKRVCPYCGQQYSGGPEPCPRCTMEDTPATRQATRSRIGPWYVLQTRNPAAPGMKYATLLALVSKGQVTPRSVLRGPTTHQLWRFAAHVRGVSREFGVCYSCGGSIQRTSSVCPHCERSQEPPVEPDVLLETRSDNQSMPSDGGANPSSHASRVAELKRQRAQGIREASSAEGFDGANAAAAGAARPRTDMIRHGGGRVVSAMELAAALQDDSSRALRPPRRRLLKAAVILVLLGGAAAAAMLYFMPQYRQPTFTWLNDTWTSVKIRAASIEWPKFSTTSSGTTKPTTPVSAPVAQEKLPEVQITTVSAPRPADPPEKPAAPIDKPAAPAPQIVIQPPPQPVEISADAALDRARQLWAQAIDAEARQDFGGAARLYEQIKRLPMDAWPAGLQLRLSEARKRSESSSAAQ